MKGSSIYAASDKKFDENTEVVIIYQPEDPKKFFVEGQNPTAFAYIGILMFVGTYTYLVYWLYERDPGFFHGLLHF
ncbi:hypothetical protein [Spirosoma sordidisoli]|uniref:DUF3592 domain-containing protein n=1 Tax=Spirosoma sordidisoli TaxID=2502893 RepID=A0A4Q2UHY8_9BACT|nr:hypothetical protein [Spirosoma sordidisoli]RYC68152.1 hypothetical protein EQG79_22135 [Spirosoma sordidisoli]